ncbi:unnamed protein product, partial [marine sediment metagenome]
GKVSVNYEGVFRNGYIEKAHAATASPSSGARRILQKGRDDKTLLPNRRRFLGL